MAAFYELDLSLLDALKVTHPPNTPIHMLNLLRFRPTAIYPPKQPTAGIDPTNANEPKDSATTDQPDNESADLTGHQVYQTRYIPSLAPFVAAHPGAMQLVWFGEAFSDLAAVTDGSGPVKSISSSSGDDGGEEKKERKKKKWDMVALVRYRDVDAFEALVYSDVYKRECLRHRLAALEEVSLVPLSITDAPVA